MVDQGASAVAVVGMDHLAGPLIHKKDVFVFIYDVQRGVGDGEKSVFRAGPLEKFVVDIQLHQVSLIKAHVALAALAVDLDPLQADILLQQGRRQQGHRFCNETVQALPSVIFPDENLFQTVPSISRQYHKIIIEDSVIKSKFYCKIGKAPAKRLRRGPQDKK